MGWKHPQISLQEMVNLIKGFLEILILGCGYQSSGGFAKWDVPNVRKAFQWAEFFESVFLVFSSSEYYNESVKELDGALSELTSDPYFPQGLAHFSSATLTRARKVVVEQLIRGLPIRSEHLRSILVASVEMDLYALPKANYDSLSKYMNKLDLQSACLESTVHANGPSEFSRDSCSEKAATENKRPVVDDWMGICIQALSRRQSSAFRAFDLLMGLNMISGAVNSSNSFECGEAFLQEQLWTAMTPMNVGKEEQRVKFMTCHQWKARSLLFFLDKRTVRLVSGARILFTTPEAQWMQLHQHLNIPKEEDGSSLVAKVELLLSGCIARRWHHLIEHFMSLSSNPVSTPEMFSEVCNLLPERRGRLLHKENLVPSMESTLIEYLTNLLDSNPYVLWRLPPILPAVAIPSSSLLFKVYVSQIESLLRDNSSTSRCCSCSQEKEHINCELAERIWCLHASHICSSHLSRNGGDD